MGHAGGSDLINLSAEFHVPCSAANDWYPATIKSTDHWYERNCDSAPKDVAVTVYRGHAGECEECEGWCYPLH